MPSILKHARGPALQGQRVEQFLLSASAALDSGERAASNAIKNAERPSKQHINNLFCVAACLHNNISSSRRVQFEEASSTRPLSKSQEQCPDVETDITKTENEKKRCFFVQLRSNFLQLVVPSFSALSIVCSMNDCEHDDVSKEQKAALDMESDCAIHISTSRTQVK